MDFDQDVERGVIFTLGLALGLVAMWLIFTARGRGTAHGVFEAAGDFMGDLGDRGGQLVERAADASAHIRHR